MTLVPESEMLQKGRALKGKWVDVRREGADTVEFKLDMSHVATQRPGIDYRDVCMGVRR